MTASKTLRPADLKAEDPRYFLKPEQVSKIKVTPMKIKFADHMKEKD